MKKLLDIVKKFWISIIVFISVALLAYIYTAGALLDILLNDESTLTVPKD
jgi:hypothetical protein